MEGRIIRWEDLSDFVIRILEHLKVTREDAEKVADNLVLCNLRGIDSHGVARLKRYVDGIKTGYIIPDIEPEVVKETGVMANIDGHNGLGQVAGVFAMRMAIEKAKKHGIGFITVFNTNHYGFAGYYPLMALKDDLIGISMTNSSPLTVPTYGRESLFGTNPIAVSAPTRKNKPWVMDFATSVVPRGKLELYSRLGEKIPDGWFIDENGRMLHDPARALHILSEHLGGGILPMGGKGETYGGHKGYGLIVMVDILTGILSGSNYGPYLVSSKDGKTQFPRIGTLFMAINPDFFVGLETFKDHLDNYIDLIKNSEKAEGHSRIYIHGEKEFEEQEIRQKNGIPLDQKTVDGLVALSKEFEEDLRFKD